MDRVGKPRLMTDTLRGCPSPSTSLGNDDARARKEKAVVAILGKLALHYWRPDFTPEQSKQLYLDYVEDLMPYAVVAIGEAAKEWRRNPANKFFPKSGELIGLITKVPSWDACATPQDYELAARRAGKAEFEMVVQKRLEKA